MEQIVVRVALVLLAAAFFASMSTRVVVSGRYLPTRSQEDRLERLRELLKDLFQNDYDPNRTYQLPEVPERAAIFKRSAGLPYPPGGNGQQPELMSGLAIPVNGLPLHDALSPARNGVMHFPPVNYDSSSSYGNFADRKVMK